MRPVRYDAEVGGGNLMDKRSLDLEHAKEAWNEWEIHCLILLSLTLQVFLFLTADLRRRSASPVLSTIVWLAYVSADAVAVFMLGHLAVHAQGQSHDLMLFWAPFVLVHLGGQETITAFSKQDNDLWTRHLLGLVTQTAVAGYVVSRSSWPDAQLRAAMVFMFLCGFLKYAGRTLCLFSASPKHLRSVSLDSLIRMLRQEQDGQADSLDGRAIQRFQEMFHADRCREFVKKNRVRGSVDDIMLDDALADDFVITLATDLLPDMLKEVMYSPDRCLAYLYVATSLVQSYQCLYTKAPLSIILREAMNYCSPRLFWCPILVPLVLTHTLLHCILTAIALVLFVFAQKEGHYSKADVTVSYILLVGAIALDLLPTFTSIVSYSRKPFRPGTVVQCAAWIVRSCIQPLGWRTRKLWSEELAQYSMIKRYTRVQCYYACLSSFWNWILKRKPFGTWCAEYLDLTQTPVTDHLKLFVLDRLLLLQARRQEWDFASFRGLRALEKWMDSHLVPEREWSRYDEYAALHETLSSSVEFPTSIVIWHIATDICYFSGANGPDTAPDESDETKIKKMMAKELSHYIMYLVFKYDVMLTRNSQLVHKKTHEELTKYFRQVRVDEKETVILMFESMKNEVTSIRSEIVEREQEEQQGLTVEELQAIRIRRQRERRRMTVEALYFPVLPRAHAVAQELIDINDEADRWQLILEVWLEMLFYTAPRCGAAFHYEHLSTGGEFITHVLFLMRSLGPFMPKPSDINEERHSTATVRRTLLVI